MRTKKNLVITEAREIANGFPLEVDIVYNNGVRTYVQKENDLYHCFRFAKWLEDLPKGNISGTIVLLRKYLEENYHA